MGWLSIREYTDRTGVSVSTVRRQIQEGKVFARKFGRHWYVQPPTDRLALPSELEPQAPSGDLQSVVQFSSKALHHYLILHERLMVEKDARLSERDARIQEGQQKVAELEAYVNMLEVELARQKEKPEGWY